MQKSLIITIFSILIVGLVFPGLIFSIDQDIKQTQDVDKLYNEKKEDLEKKEESSEKEEDKENNILDDGVSFDISNIQEICAPIAGEILFGIISQDYDQFCRHCSEYFKANSGKLRFKRMSSNIRERYGEYVSHKFHSAQDNIASISAFYKVTFSKSDEDVLMRIDLERVDKEIFFLEEKNIALKLQNEVFVTDISFSQ